MSSSIPSWQILTAHAQTFWGVRDLAFCLKVPLDSLLWASSEGSGEIARMRRLAWTFTARIGYKYQIRLTRSTCKQTKCVLTLSRGDLQKTQSVQSSISIIILRMQGASICIFKYFRAFDVNGILEKCKAIKLKRNLFDSDVMCNFYASKSIFSETKWLLSELIIKAPRNY